MRFTLRNRCDKSTGFIGAYQLIPLIQHQGATALTFHIGRPLPHHKIAFRIINTAIIFSALFGLLQDNILAAFRSGYTDLLVVGLGIAALRESRTCQESSMGTIFDHHIPSAEFTDLV